MINFRLKAETAFIKKLITEIYPKGIISYVADSFNLWDVIGHSLPKLKEIILARDGKVVIRPDSGDPVDIICGIEGTYFDKSIRTAKEKGIVECLWDIFGGTINSKGYKELDSHIGTIYGDSITLARVTTICERLKNKGFASTNIIFGLGSYTYQYNTRDTLGWAMKCTYAEINGNGVNIYKDPITDDGTKKSAKGLLRVIKSFADGSYMLDQECTWDEFNAPDNELKLVYKDGKIYG